MEEAHIKRGISKKDLRLIAEYVGVSVEEVREALALLGHQDQRETIENAAKAMGYIVTLRDRVAMAAGVSIATVNLAYRPAESHRVSAAVRETIREQAKRLGYVPDLLTRNLRSSHGRIVAICPAESQLSNPYFGYAVQALSTELSQAGYHPVISPIRPGQDLPDFALSASTAGLVLWGSSDPEAQLSALQSTGQKAVLLGYHPQMTSVSIDPVTAYHDLTTYALRSGFTALHLGYFNPRRWQVASRLEGVAQALSEQLPTLPVRLWLTVDEQLGLDTATSSLRERNFHAAAALLQQLGEHTSLIRKSRSELQTDRAREILSDIEQLQLGEQQRVAVLGQSDFVARQLITLLGETHPEWRLGHEIGVAGHDNIEPLLGFGKPIITTIDYNLTEMAQAIVELLRQAITDPEYVPQHRTVGHRLILRQSL